jgi:hypothetical protein
MVRAALMEIIMSKTTYNEVTELSLEELESVSGGVELVHEAAHAAVSATPTYTTHYMLLARFGRGF